MKGNKEAMFYKKNINNVVVCELCPRFCALAEGKTGFCRARKNIGGKLISLVYGKPCSLAVDPIEKKPLFHFAPGSRTLSVATVGCTLACKHCQNWEISQAKEVIGNDLLPEQLLKEIKQSNAQGFSWTYTEPTAFYEYFYDTANLCKKEKKDFYHVWVSNGFTCEEPIKKAAKLIDAVNIDYKGDDNFYKKVCAASLEPVREAIKIYKKLGVWIEITNLLIPGKNDSEEQIREMCSWIKDLGNMPLHISRFFPHHKMASVPKTDEKTLEKAVKIAEEYLDYVYIGNIRSSSENTYCPNCKNLLIERIGYFVNKIDIKKGKCPYCSNKIPLAGMKWSAFKDFVE